MKVYVRIHTGDGVEVVKRKIDNDGKITVFKRSRNSAGWRLEPQKLEPKHKWFSRVEYYVDSWLNAPKSWLIKSDLKEIDKPELTQDEVMKFAKAKVFEKRYQTEPKPFNPMLIYIILILQIVSIVFTFLLSSGRLRL